jgi:hypothetical protein
MKSTLYADPKSMLFWVDANVEIPKRDIPVIVLVRDGKRTFCTPSHRMAFAWSGIKSPSVVTHWAAMPKPPTIGDEQ